LANYTDRFFTEVVPVDIDILQLLLLSNRLISRTTTCLLLPLMLAELSRVLLLSSQWDQFSDVMNRSPENAWRYLSSMGPEALRSKLLFMDAA
jgi:hypothetical protein